MNVKELNREQLIELKQHYLCFDKYGEEYQASWGELANVDEDISDEEIFDYYDYVTFCNDDFFCTAGQ